MSELIQRAYALLTVKAVDDEARSITGIATTPTPDRLGDIVDPEGAEFKLPLPLLWQHDSRQPVGHVTAAKVTGEGIDIKAQFVKIDEEGTLKNRLDEAWLSVKSGLVKGLSIGFKPIESSRLEDSFALRFIKWMWLELSVVTIPANQDATITAVKAMDNGVLEGLALKRTAPVTPGGKPREPVILRKPPAVYPIRVVSRGE
jgi:HK97 family phage prohead protease